MIVALGVTVTALAFGRGASGETGPVLSFDVGAPGGCVEVGVGAEIDTALMITDVEELQAWEATISHDFGVIRIIEQDARTFLEQGGGTLIEASEPLPDNDGQHLLAVAATKAVSAIGPSILATIRFKAVGTGMSIIDIPQIDVGGDGRADQGVSLKIGSTFIGDVNGDSFFDGLVQSARIAVNASCVSPTEQPTDPPTPKPATPTASPSATPTPTTSTPPQSAGPTTSTDPSATTVETPSGGFDATWGDNNCSQQVDPVDSLFVLRGDAGLPTNTGDCPEMGANIEVLNASPHVWGDVDCTGSMTPVDSLKTLRYDAGLSVSVEDGCPEIASAVTITES